VEEQGRTGTVVASCSLSSGSFTLWAMVLRVKFAVCCLNFFILAAYVRIVYGRTWVGLYKNG